MDEEAQGQAPNEVAEEVSLGDRMPESEPMIEQEEEDDAQNQSNIDVIQFVDQPKRQKAYMLTNSF